MHVSLWCTRSLKGFGRALALREPAESSCRPGVNAGPRLEKDRTSQVVPGRIAERCMSDVANRESYGPKREHNRECCRSWNRVIPGARCTFLSNVTVPCFCELTAIKRDRHRTPSLYREGAEWHTIVAPHHLEFKTDHKLSVVGQNNTRRIEPQAIDHH